jgi:hypothetical protein
MKLVIIFSFSVVNTQGIIKVGCYKYMRALVDTFEGCIGSPAKTKAT